MNKKYNESDVSDLPKQLAKGLLSIGAVVLRPNDPFTWSSGMKAPIYCDNRLTMSHPIIRNRIATEFSELIAKTYPEVEVIAGTSTAGIPHAAWVAEKMNLPMVYVRDKAKGHGKQNLIEGDLKPGQKVVVIEDLISTGGSSLKAAIAVNEAGGKTLAVAAIFTYEMDKANENFAQHNIPLHTLSNYSALIDAALETGDIKQADIALLQAWRENN